MAMKTLVLCDTNILIELSKNNDNIRTELNKIGVSKIAISAVSVGESTSPSISPHAPGNPGNARPEDSPYSSRIH